jgi:predicted metal-dependent hydrolase
MALDGILDDYLDGVLERNPHVATVLGVHDYDGEVPSGTRASVEEEIEAARGLRDELDGYEGYEAELVRASLDYDLYEMDEVRAWERDPQAADALVSFVYSLYARNFAPFHERVESIADRLEAAPEYLEESRDRVVEPVGAWVELEREACETVPGFLQLIADEAGGMERQDLAYRVSVACEGVVDALDEHLEWLESVEKSSDWRVGRETLDELLSRRFLPPSEHIAGLAEDEMEAANEALAEAVGELGAEPTDAVDAVEADRPAPDAVLDEYVDAVRGARSFASSVVELPQEGVNVAETPEHLAPLVPDTAYFEPTPFGDETPAYYVTPSGDHPRAEIAGRAVTDLYPGAHLQKSFEAAGASKAVVLAGRFNAFGDDFVEGWKGYAERLAVESGHGDARFRAYAARNRLVAACRALVDVKLQTGEMTVRDAASFLADEAGVGGEEAVAEVRGYGREPGAQVSRLVGTEALLELCDGSDADFRSRLLNGGGVPVEFHERRLDDG